VVRFLANFDLGRFPVRHFSGPDFVRLIQEVERQGGTYPMEVCAASEIKELSRPGHKPAMSNGCGEAALFHVNYDPSASVDVPEPLLVPDESPNAPMGRTKQRRDEDGRAEWSVVRREGVEGAGPATATACANDDLMREWPRYRHVIADVDPTRGY
jgi:hypothetical protein